VLKKLKIVTGPRVKIPQYRHYCKEEWLDAVLWPQRAGTARSATPMSWVLGKRVVVEMIF